MNNVLKHILPVVVLGWTAVNGTFAQVSVGLSSGTTTYFTAPVNGTVQNATPDVTNDYFGFVYSVSQSEVYKATTISLGTGDMKEKDNVNGTGSQWDAEIQNLEPGTTYYIRSVYGVMNAGTMKYTLSNVGYFTTKSVAPITDAATQVGVFSATINAQKPNANAVAGGEYYFVYSTEYQTINGSTTAAMAGEAMTASENGSALSVNLNELSPETRYYYRPVCGVRQADNSIKYYYGDIKSFTTGTLVPVTGDATNVKYFSATISETAPAIAEAESGYMGFVYSTTSHMPACDDTESTVTYGSTDVVTGGTFTLDLTDLEQNTTYYYRAYEYVSVPGVGASYYYGAVKSFTTTSYNVKSTGVTTDGYFKANATGTVSDVASLGANVECGFAYSATNTNPTEVDNVVYASAAAASFTATLVDLEAGVTYYYRAIARAYKNGGYVYYYGDVRSFGTASITVNTLGVSNIGYYKATLSGSVSGNRNGYTYGVIYSITAGVSSENGKVVECEDALASGEYTKEITKLGWGTKYFYVAYARQPLTNGQYRYYYGEERQFATKGSNPNPVTAAATQVLTDGATFNGSISTESIDLGTTVLGFVYSATNGNPEIGDATTSSATYAVEAGFDGTYAVAVSGLESMTKYYYKAYAQVTIEDVTTTYYGNVMTATTGNASMVDLGLSVRWANCNIGASSPEEYGSYIAWGETSSKTSYDWSTYTLCSGSDTTITKYCTDVYYGHGMKDGLTELAAANDVATVAKGSMWRMPTQAEMNELMTQCTWTWTQKNDVYGYEVTGPSGNSIFLPAAGHMSESSVKYQGSYGHYWTSTLGEVSSSSAYAIYFSANSRTMTTDNNNSYLRCQGFSVRAVAP